jgi:hypothetical protein
MQYSLCFNFKSLRVDLAHRDTKITPTIIQGVNEKNDIVIRHKPYTAKNQILYYFYIKSIAQCSLIPFIDSCFVSSCFS